MAERSLRTVVQHLRCLAGRTQPTDASDSELLSRFITRRDEAAFAALVRRHGLMVRDVCRRLLPHDADVDDAFQAVFLTLANQAGSVRKRRSLASWLHGVAYRVALSARRQAGRRSRHERRSLPATPPPPEQEVCWREVCAILDEELQALPERHRAPLVLCYLASQSRDEAARQLGLSLRTLDRRLAQGRALLRARLERRGLTMSAALLLAGLSSRAAAALPMGTVRAAVTAACDSGPVSLGATVLSSAVLEGATAAKRHLVTAVVLAAGLLAGAMGTLAHWALARQPPEHPRTLFIAHDAEPRQSPPRTDGDGDPLPAGALARLGTMRYRSGFVLYQVVFSPDGRRLAVASAGAGVEIFDRATGRLLHRFPRPTHVYSLAFSPDGKVLAAPGGYEGNRYQLRLLDVDSGRVLRQVPVSRLLITCVAYSPNGRLLACGGNGKQLHLIETKTRREVRKLEASKSSTWRLAFSPDSRLLAYAAVGGAVGVYDAQTGAELRHWTVPVDKSAGYCEIAFTADNRTVLCGAVDGVRLWDITGKEPGRTLPDAAKPVRALAVAPGGKAVAAGFEDGEVRIFDLPTGKQLCRWQAYPYRVETLAFSPDGRTVATGSYWFSRIRLWEARTGKELNPCQGHQGTVVELAFSPDGQELISVGRDHLVCRWDAKTGVERSQFPAVGSGPLWSAAIFPGAKVVASRGYTDQVIHLWATDTGKQLSAFPGPPLPRGRLGFRAALAVSPDGRTLAAGGAILGLYDVGTGKSIRDVDGLKEVSALAYSPGGGLLAAAYNRPGFNTVAGIQLLDPRTGKQTRRLGRENDLYGLNFSPDGRLLAVAQQDPGAVALWDVNTGQQLRRFPGQERCFYAVAFSPDGRLVAGAGGDDITITHVWEVVSGAEVRTFRGERDGMMALAWTPDGRALASGGDGTIMLWDVSGQALGRVKPPRTVEDVRACWNDLGADNAGRAVDAAYALRAAPALAVPLLSERLGPARALDSQHLKKLLADLDSPRFRRREQATSELLHAGDGIVPALRKALTDGRSPEARRRLQQVLDSLTRGTDSLRMMRVIGVLEDIGTPEARVVLEHLASGLPGARRTQEAKAALQRLGKR